MERNSRQSWKRFVQLSISLLIILSMASLSLAQQKPLCDGACAIEPPPCCDTASSNHNHMKPSHSKTTDSNSHPCCEFEFCDFGLNDDDNSLIANNTQPKLQIDRLLTIVATGSISPSPNKLPPPPLISIKTTPIIKLNCVYLI